MVLPLRFVGKLFNIFYVIKYNNILQYLKAFHYYNLYFKFKCIDCMISYYYFYFEKCPIIV